MRRKDREMDAIFGRKVIDKSKYASISVVDESGLPYGIPISTVRVGDKLYLHSAMGGRKVELFTPDKAVCMVFVADVHVPELYSTEELNEMANDESRSSLLARRVFTTEFGSAVVKGKINIIDDQKERVTAFTALCKKYCPGKEYLINAAIRAGAQRAYIYGVDILELTAKRKKYDIDGREMKGTKK